MMARLEVVFFSFYKSSLTIPLFENDIKIKTGLKLPTAFSKNLAWLSHQAII